MANNLSIKIDLLKLKGATVINLGKNNTPCIAIPIEMASLYKGEKSVSLDLQAFPLKEQKQNSKDTHLVKQSFGKEKFAAMTDEQKKAVPIIGNVIEWGSGGNGGGNSGSSSPAASAAPSWM